MKTMYSAYKQHAMRMYAMGFTLEQIAEALTPVLASDPNHRGRPWITVGRLLGWKKHNLPQDWEQYRREAILGEKYQDPDDPLLECDARAAALANEIMLRVRQHLLRTTGIADLRQLTSTLHEAQEIRRTASGASVRERKLLIETAKRMATLQINAGLAELSAMSDEDLTREVERLRRIEDAASK